MKTLICSVVMLAGLAGWMTPAATAMTLPATSEPSANRLPIDTLPIDTLPIDTVPTHTPSTHTPTSPTPTTSTHPTPTPAPVAVSRCDLTGLTHVEEADGTIVVLPESYDAQQQYPAIVVLPYTDSPACRFFNWALRDRYVHSETPYIAILPAATASRADYSTGEGFEATVERFETLIKSDLRSLQPKYRIDASRVSLAGFSFGADLGWALSLRNPGLFRGGFLIDSLCSYRDDRNMTQLAQRSPHFFLVAGRKEDSELQHPMNEVKTLLEGYRIPTVYESLPDASHGEIIDQISAETYQNALAYILAR